MAKKPQSRSVFNFCIYPIVPSRYSPGSNLKIAPAEGGVIVLMGLSLSHILLVLVIILIVFGAGKLPQVMGDLAKGFKAFKNGLSDEEEHAPSTPPILKKMSQKRASSKE